MSWIAKVTLAVVLIIGLGVQATGQNDRAEVIGDDTSQVDPVPAARTPSAVDAEDVPKALEGELTRETSPPRRLGRINCI